MATFEFSLDNGMALIMPAGGGTACGMNFTAGANDTVFQINGEYSMTIDSEGNVTITLYNMHGLIFPNKANYSGWLYYDTLWARAHDNCLHVALDVGLTRQAHGGWSDDNPYWHHQVTGWKGGTGIRGYDQWIKYHYDIVEPACAGEYTGSGCCGAGSYIGSAKDIPAQVFSLGKVNFETTDGFWIGANLDCYEGGWEQWLFVPFPITVFEAPEISTEITSVDICEEIVFADISVVSNSVHAASGGEWEVQYSTSSDFSNAVTLSKTSSSNSVVFEDNRLLPNTNYYIRARLKVSDILYSGWANTNLSVGAYIPSADAMAKDISEQECYDLQHGLLIEGGLI